MARTPRIPRGRLAVHTAALQEGLRLYQTVFERSAVGQLIVDLPSNRVDLANRAFSAISGFTIDELVGGDISVIFPADQDPAGEALEWIVDGQTESYTAEKYLQRRDGTMLPVHCTVSVVSDADQRPIQLVVAVQDRTRQRDDAAVQRRSQALIDAAIAALPMTFTAFDTDLRFTYVAGGLERPGTKLADFLGHHVTEYTQHRPTLHALQRALGGAESTTRDVVNGQSYLTLHGPIRDDRQRIVGVISVSTNVTTDATAETARRQAEELRLYVAQHDPLTGLPGRAALIELLTTLAWSGPGPGALLIIDLDDFQLINEGLGHEVGDAVLLEVGARMARAFPDSMVARKGGDEFAVVFTADIGRDQALAAAARAQATLATPISVIGHDLQLTAGVGVALKPTHSSSSTLLVDADTALSSAKAHGIAQSRLYDYEMRRAAEERLSIQSGLRTALRTGGLRLAYQPIVHLADRLVVGAEALLRWDHAVRGAIPPDVFIPIAEQCGLIHPIGGWVMDRACDDFSALHRDGGLYIAVNVSVRQLTERSFAGWIDQVLDAKNLSPAGLTIEVTEGALMEDDGSIGRAFAQLRSRGVRIAIDDFGTGYSSLARLQRLPVDIVKLDRAFVTALDSRPEARVMAAAILHLSTAIGAEIIAEGVETEAEAAILLDLGYTTAQGFLFARPMPLAQFRVHSGSPVLGRR